MAWYDDDNILDGAFVTDLSKSHSGRLHRLVLFPAGQFHLA